VGIVNIGFIFAILSLLYILYIRIIKKNKSDYSLEYNDIIVDKKTGHRYQVIGVNEFKYLLKNLDRKEVICFDIRQNHYFVRENISDDQ
jgi:predicted protein tyrosine phosphatase